MIGYEIQLRYLIRDKIQSEKKFVKKKIFCRKNCLKKNIVSDVVSDFQCAKCAVSYKSMLIITKQYIYTAIRPEACFTNNFRRPPEACFTNNFRRVGFQMGATPHNSGPLVSFWTNVVFTVSQNLNLNHL